MCKFAGCVCVCIYGCVCVSVYVCICACVYLGVGERAVNVCSKVGGTALSPLVITLSKLI